MAPVRVFGVSQFGCRSYSAMAPVRGVSPFVRSYSSEAKKDDEAEVKKDDETFDSATRQKIVTTYLSQKLYMLLLKLKDLLILKLKELVRYLFVLAAAGTTWVRFFDGKDDENNGYKLLKKKMNEKEELILEKILELKKDMSKLEERVAQVEVVTGSSMALIKRLLGIS